VRHVHGRHGHDAEGLDQLRLAQRDARVALSEAREPLRAEDARGLDVHLRRELLR